MTVLFNDSCRRDVRIQGLGKNSQNLNFSTFENHLGYKIHIAGDDLVLRSDEIDSKKRNPLAFSPLIPISNRELVVQTIMGGLSVPFEGKYREPSLERLDHYEKFGIIAELYKKQYEFYALPKDQLPSFIKGELLPFLEREFETKYVLSSSLDADYVQAAISFFKFIYLTDSLGKDQARNHVENERTTDGIAPMSLDYQKYINSVLVSLPVSSVIEFERPGMILYFTKANPWIFPYIATANLFDHLVRSSDPMIGRSADIRILANLLRGRANPRYVEKSLDMFASFTDKLLDPRSYTDKTGVFSSESAFLVNTAFRLLFHEVSDVGTCNSRYMRQRVALLSLDKIANLIGAMGDAKPDEAEIFNRLFDRNSERIVCAELGKIGESLSGKHSGAFQRFGHTCFQNLRNTTKHLERPSEEIRVFRNLNHGIFLRSEGFKKVFVTGSGVVPDEISWLPFIYVLAIVNNPSVLKDLTKR